MITEANWVRRRQGHIMDGKGTTCMLEEKPKYLKFLTPFHLGNLEQLSGTGVICYLWYVAS